MNSAVDDKGLIWTWGQNKMGELGLGDCDPRLHPFPVLNLKGKFVTNVCCGDDFVMCLGKNIKKEVVTQAEVHTTKSNEQRKSRSKGSRNK